MMTPSDLKKKIYFYDDRNKADGCLILKEILYQDEDCCFCRVNFISYEDNDEASEEKLLFNFVKEEVLSIDYQFWIPTTKKPRRLT